MVEENGNANFRWITATWRLIWLRLPLMCRAARMLSVVELLVIPHPSWRLFFRLFFVYFLFRLKLNSSTDQCHLRRGGILSRHGNEIQQFKILAPAISVVPTVRKWEYFTIICQTSNGETKYLISEIPETSSALYSQSDRSMFQTMQFFELSSV